MDDGKYEYGDTYVKDIVTYGSLIDATEDWKKAYGHLKERHYGYYNDR